MVALWDEMEYNEISPRWRFNEKQIKPMKVDNDKGVASWWVFFLLCGYECVGLSIAS
jgi:hypothetical protein